MSYGVAALPWRTRLRLAAARRADMTACWLIKHRRFGLGIALWRASGLWT